MKRHGENVAYHENQTINQFLGDEGPPDPPGPPLGPRTPTKEASRTRSETRYNPYGIGYNTTSSGNVRGSNVRGRSTLAQRRQRESNEDL